MPAPRRAIEREQADMDPQVQQVRYRRLNEHFQACADLSEPQRRDYVAGVSATDPDLGKELGSLLSHHPPTPDAVPAAASKAPVQDGTKTRWRKSRMPIPAMILTGGVLVALLILACQSWAVDQLEEHLRESAVQMLRQSVKLRSDSARAWAERQKQQARIVLEDPALVSQVTRLLEITAEPDGHKSRLLAHPAYQEVARIMSNAPPEIGDRGFAIINPSGVGLCAETDLVVGRAIAPSGGAYVRRILLGESIVSRPYPDRQFVLGLTPDFKHP